MLTSYGMLVLRIFTGGFMLALHGFPKLRKLFAEELIKFPDPFGMGSTMTLGLTVFAEVICAVMIIVGLFTRLATVPFIITMLVAIFVIHGADPISDRELAIMYLMCSVVILIVGPGRFSMDYWFQPN